MAASAPHTILLKGYARSEEAVAAAGSNIKPGMLLQRTTAGTVQPHSTAKGAAVALFAREMDIAGGTIDDVYEDGDTVLMWSCEKGDEVYAWLVDEGNVAIGALLESAGDGSLRTQTAASQLGTGTYDYTPAGQPIARAMQAVNNTGGTGPVRIKVEIL